MGWGSVFVGFSGDTQHYSGEHRQLFPRLSERSFPFGCGCPLNEAVNVSRKSMDCYKKKAMALLYRGKKKPPSQSLLPSGEKHKRHWVLTLARNLLYYTHRTRSPLAGVPIKQSWPGNVTHRKHSALAAHRPSQQPEPGHSCLQHDKVGYETR